MTGPGYPTYTENPYTGGVDEGVPTGAVSATGLAALAAKTQQDWQEDLFGGFDTTLTPLSDLLGKLFDLFSEFVDIDGFVEIASDVLGFFYNLLDRAGFFELLSGGIDLFGWLVDLGVDAIEALIKPIIEFLKSVFETLGGPVLDAIKTLFAFISDQISFTDLQGFIEQIITGLSALLNPQGFVDILKALFEYFANLSQGVNGTAEIVEQIFSKIPIIGPLVAKLTGLDSSGDIALDLATLGNWAQSLLTRTGDLPAERLIGSIPAALLGAIPVSAINLLSQNLMSQGDFVNANTVEAGGGWAWDGATTATGSGGSVKATGTGSLQQLYSRQAIKVGDGDRVDITAMVKTSGFTAAAGRSMELSIVKWKPVAGVLTNQGTEIIGTARTTSATTFTALPATPVTWTSSGGITHIQVRLAVTANAAVGGTPAAQIWFDDIAVRKSGGLQQILVDSLVTAWNQLWRGLTNPLLPFISGKTWEDLFGAASGFRSAFNTEEDRGGTLRYNLFNDRNTVGTQIQAQAIPSLASSKITGLDTALTERQNATNNLKDSIIAGYYVTVVPSSSYSNARGDMVGGYWYKPTGLSELYVAVFGGGGKGNTGASSGGSSGGLNGGFVSRNFNMADVPSSVLCTVGTGGTTTAAVPTSFGSLLTSNDAYRGFVDHPMGLVTTGSAPTDGGRGGSSNSAATAGGTTPAGVPGGTVGVIGGGYTAPAGGTGLNFGLAQTGGAGGGGFAYISVPNVGAGNGGNGGFPGGGGGGGGYNGFTGAVGTGGAGGAGLMIIVYRIAKTTT